MKKYYYIKYTLKNFPNIPPFEDIVKHGNNRTKHAYYTKLFHMRWEKCLDDTILSLKRLNIIEKKTYNSFEELINDFPELMLL